MAKKDSFESFVAKTVKKAANSYESKKAVIAQKVNAQLALLTPEKKEEILKEFSGNIIPQELAQKFAEKHGLMPETIKAIFQK